MGLSNSIGSIASTGNKDLDYALKSAGLGYSQSDVDKYVNDLNSRVGSVSANSGKVLSQSDINKELDRLGVGSVNNSSGGSASINNSVSNAITSTGNTNLDYALKSAGLGYSQSDIDKYVSDLTSRVGSVSGNSGKVLSQSDINRELNRLGFSVSDSSDNNEKWLSVSDGKGFNQQYLLESKDYKLNNGGGVQNLANGDVAYFAKGNSGVGSSLGEAMYNANFGSTSSAKNNNALNNAIKSKQDEINGYLDKLSNYRNSLQLDMENEAREAYVKVKKAEQTMKNSLSVAGLSNGGVLDKKSLDLKEKYEKNRAELMKSYEDKLKEVAESEAEVKKNGATDLSEIYDYYNEKATNAINDAEFVSGLSGDDSYRRMLDFVNSGENYDDKLSRVKMVADMGASKNLVIFLLENIA